MLFISTRIRIRVLYIQVYYLANVRLRELAERFGWVPEQVLRCWSLLVICIRYSTVQLMRDRHLDQLLLCSIHAIARVGLIGFFQIQFTILLIIVVLYYK